MFVNEKPLSAEVLNTLAETNDSLQAELLPQIGETALSVKNLLLPEELAALKDELAAREWQAVGQNGMSKDYNPDTDIVGSYRTSAYSQELADTLWSRIQPLLPETRTMHDLSPTDWDSTKTWRPVGVNPLMRFIKYEPEGLLVPHYDAPFVYDENKRTLMSLVLYLDKSDDIEGGRTRYIQDAQANVPVADRPAQEDWQRLARPDEVRYAADPAAGEATIFDHRILHDGELVQGIGQKLLLRTDVAFVRDEDK
jgi:hypothetical protein